MTKVHEVISLPTLIDDSGFLKRAASLIRMPSPSFQDEFAKMKAELEAEYLATFKKTVAMHEMFLQRLASHRIFKNDPNFRIFLTYKDDLSVRGRNKARHL